MSSIHLINFRWIFNIHVPHSFLTILRWIFEIHLSNVQLMTSQMDIHRWIFDIRISNVHVTTSQMDISYSNVKHPFDQLPDGYSIFEPGYVFVINIVLHQLPMIPTKFIQVTLIYYEFSSAKMIAARYSWAVILDLN